MKYSGSGWLRSSTSGGTLMWGLSSNSRKAVVGCSVSTPASPFDSTFSLYRNSLSALLTRSLSLVMCDSREAWPPPATVLASITSPLSSSSTLEDPEKGLSLEKPDTKLDILLVAQAVAVMDGTIEERKDDVRLEGWRRDARDDAKDHEKAAPALGWSGPARTAGAAHAAQHKPSTTASRLFGMSNASSLPADAFWESGFEDGGTDQPRRTQMERGQRVDPLPTSTPSCSQVSSARAISPDVARLRKVSTKLFSERSTWRMHDNGMLARRACPCHWCTRHIGAST